MMLQTNYELQLKVNEIINPDESNDNLGMGQNKIFYSLLFCVP